MMKTKIFLFLLLSLGVAHVTFAASTDFRIRTLVGSDTTPPSTPTLTSAIPVSQSQIDISWSASTDNFIFGGYRVYRNAVQIATTTLTSYSDSGLSASTTYTYSVQAFDSVFNYSSTSNSLATSTPALVVITVPPVVPESRTTSYGQQMLTLTDFSITTSLHDALFSWKTSSYARFQLRWGRTSSYELGFVSHDLFQKEHKTAVTDLSPGTTYEFELVGYTRNGFAITLKRGQFKTANAPDTQAPTNVTNLSAYIVGNSVHLSWTNPTDADFSHIRVVRNNLFFPTDTADGFLAYQGSGFAFTDAGALVSASLQYYTVFTYDVSGNISSGAIVAVVQKGDPNPHIATTTNPKFPLTFKDVEFLQHGEPLSEKGLETNGAIVIRIAYAKLPEHLKTITITFTDPQNKEKTLSYLLRINKDKTFYEALIAPLEVVGTYPVFVSVYDFQTQTLTAIAGSVLVRAAFFESAQNFVGPFSTTLALHSEWITELFFFIIICIIVLFFKFFTLKRKEQ